MSTPNSEDQRHSEGRPSKEEKPSKRANRPLKFGDDLSDEMSAQVDRNKDTKQTIHQKSSPKSSTTAKHYCYSVDLRSLKNLDTERTIRCFCRWGIFVFSSDKMTNINSPAYEAQAYAIAIIRYKFFI